MTADKLFTESRVVHSAGTTLSPHATCPLPDAAHTTARRGRWLQKHFIMNDVVNGAMGGDPNAWLHSGPLRRCTLETRERAIYHSSAPSRSSRTAFWLDGWVTAIGCGAGRPAGASATACKRAASAKSQPTSWSSESIWLACCT